MTITFPIPGKGSYAGSYMACVTFHFDGEKVTGLDGETVKQVVTDAELKRDYWHKDDAICVGVGILMLFGIFVFALGRVTQGIRYY